MLNFAANISLMFTEWALPDRFAAARDAGFAGVEVQFPYEVDAGLLAARREAADIEVVLINTPVLPEEGHPAGIACQPHLRDQFRASLERAAEYREALGPGKVNILAGQAPLSDLVRSTLIDNLTLAHQRLSMARAVLFEPLNPVDVPGYAVPSFDEALAVIAHCPAPIGLQFDIYHAAAMGLDPAATLDRVLPHVRHVQFADWPGRHEPGTGNVAIVAALDRLERSGYSGWVGAEYRPIAATLDGLDWLAPWQDRYRALQNSKVREQE